MNNSASRALGVAVTLVATWTVAEAAPLTFQLDTSDQIQNPYAVLFGGSGEVLFYSLGTVPVGQSSFPTTFDDSYYANTAFFGISSTGSAIVDLNASSIGLNGNFEDLFNMSEDAFITAVENFDETTLYNFAQTNRNLISNPNETTATLLRFSAGFPTGTYVATAVPEPGTWAALALGALVMLRRRK